MPSSPFPGYTPVSQFGADLISYMLPWMTLPLAWYCDAIGVMVDPLTTIISDVGVDDGRPTIGTYDQFGALVTQGYQAGYGTLLNPAQVPLVDAQYLAQWVGVTLPIGVAEPMATSLILAEAGFHRGTPAAIIAAVTRHLSGTQNVQLLERVNGLGAVDAYAFTVVVHPGEVVSIPDLVAAVNAVKPGGVMWTLIQVAWTITEMEVAYPASISALEGAFVTLTGLEANQPGF